MGPSTETIPDQIAYLIYISFNQLERFLSVFLYSTRLLGPCNKNSKNSFSYPQKQHVSAISDT